MQCIMCQLLKLRTSLCKYNAELYWANKKKNAPKTHFVSPCDRLQQGGASTSSRLPYVAGQVSCCMWSSWTVTGARH